MHNPPIRSEDGSWLESNSEKASAFAAYLEKVFQPYPQLDDNEDEYVEHFLNSPNQLELSLEKITINQVRA